MWDAYTQAAHETDLPRGSDRSGGSTVSTYLSLDSTTKQKTLVRPTPGSPARLAVARQSGDVCDRLLRMAKKDTRPAAHRCARWSGWKPTFGCDPPLPPGTLV